MESNNVVTDEELMRIKEEAEKASENVPPVRTVDNLVDLENVEYPIPEKPEEVEIPLSAITYDEAPEVAEQRRNLYSELEAVMEARKKQADAKEKSLLIYARKLSSWENSLKDKSVQIKQEEIESKTAIEKYREERMQDCDLREKAVSDREGKVTFRENNLEISKATLEKERNDFEEMKRITLESDGSSELEVAGLQKEVEELTNENNTLREINEKKDTLIEAYGARYEADKERFAKLEMTSQEMIAKTKREADTRLERLSQSSEEAIAKLQADNEKLSTEIAELNAYQAELRNTLNDANAELEEFRSHTPEAETEAMMKVLSSEGIHLQKETEEGSPVLRGDMGDGILLSVYPDINLLVCSKEVKKSKKIEASMESWNVKSNRCTYLYMQGRLICRYVAANPIDSAVKLVTAMRNNF